MSSLLIITLAAVALAIFLLAIGIILKPAGRFPNTHVGGNEAMRRRGISCHTSQHRDAQRAQSLAERIAAQERAH